MATFLDLKNRVTRTLMDAPANTLLEVPLYINEAMSKLQNKHNFFVMQATITYTTTAARTLGTVPADWKHYRGKPYVLNFLGGGHWVEIATSRSQAEGYRSVVDTGGPQVILKAEEATDGTGSFEIYPLSNSTSDYADGEYRVTVPYWKYLAALSADADTNWFLQQDDAVQYIVREAVANGFEFNEDDNRADRWHTRAAETYHDILLLDKYRWLSASETLVPHQGALTTGLPF